MMLAADGLPVYVPLLFLAVPAVVVIVGVALFVNSRRRVRRLATVPAGWVRAAGMVTDEITRYEWRGHGSNSSRVFIRQPIVTYRTSLGHDVTFTSAITGTFMPKPGVAVTVSHDPTDPSRARIAPESIPKTPTAFSVLAMIFVFVIGVPFVAIFTVIGVLLLRSG